MVPGRWVWKDIETHASPRRHKEKRKMKGRTTWRSRSGTTETSYVKRKDEDNFESAGAEGQRSVRGVADAELRKWTVLTTLTARTTRTTLMAEEEMVTMTEMEAVMVRASATRNKKTVMEDDDAGTTAVTIAMQIPSKPKQTGTTPEVDQHHHRQDIIHLRKQQWRWERPFYSS
jgi:hypothetical protein